MRMMSDKKVCSEDMARASNSFECITTTKLFYQIFNSSESVFFRTLKKMKSEL